MSRRLVVIGAPSSAAAYAPGQEQAPAAFRQYGLIEALRVRGAEVSDHGDTRGFRWRPDPANPAAANLAVAVDVARSVAELVAAAIAETDGADAVIVLGGDCTVGVGTVAGLVGTGERVGLVYIDGDVDLNTPATGDGPLDWMGVAHMLDVDGVEDTLAGVGPRRPLLATAAVLFVAPSNITPPEQALIDRHAMRVIPYEDVAADPNGAAQQVTAWTAGFDRILVHLDADVLAYIGFPIAEGTYRRPGLELDALRTILRAVCALATWRGVTITEVNPDHAPDPDVIFGRFINMLADAMVGDSAAAT